MSSEEPTATELAPGSLFLDKYTIEKTLGEGSYGKVKLALNNITGENVALKIISKSMIKKQVHITRIKREVRIMRLLTHPNIAKLNDVTETEKDIVLSMEYVPGGELFNYIVAQKRLKEKVARDLFRQIVSAIEYCHGSCVIHRDLKPENLLLSNDLSIKIIDFGFVNVFDPTDKLGTFCGSPYYASPEMINGKKYTGPEVDIWSMGVILFTLLGGYLPFHDQNTPELFKRISSANYKIPDYFTASDLIKHILVVDTEKRATMDFIRNHPWVNEGFDGPPKSYLPERPFFQSEADLDEKILAKMSSYGFGTFPKELICSQSNNSAFSIYYLIKENMEKRKKFESNEMEEKELAVDKPKIPVIVTTSTPPSDSPISPVEEQKSNPEKQVSLKLTTKEGHLRARSVSANTTVKRRSNTINENDENKLSAVSESHADILPERKKKSDDTRQRAATLDPMSSNPNNSGISGPGTSSQKVPAMRKKATSQLTPLLNHDATRSDFGEHSNPRHLRKSSKDIVRNSTTSVQSTVSTVSGTDTHTKKAGIKETFMKLIGKSGTVSQSQSFIHHKRTTSSDLRVVVQTKLMDTNSTSTKPVSEIKDEVNKALLLSGIRSTWITPHLTKCTQSSVVFEIEICSIKATMLKAVVFKRVKGNAYDYSEVVRNLTKNWKL